MPDRGTDRRYSWYEMILLSLMQTSVISIIWYWISEIRVIRNRQETFSTNVQPQYSSRNGSNPRYSAKHSSDIANSQYVTCSVLHSDLVLTTAKVKEKSQKGTWLRLLCHRADWPDILLLLWAPEDCPATSFLWGDGCLEHWKYYVSLHCRSLPIASNTNK